MKKPILLFLALFATLLSPASPRLLTPVSAPSDVAASSEVLTLAARLSDPALQPLKVTLHGDSLSVESDGRRRVWFAWRGDTAHYAGEETITLIEAPRLPVPMFAVPVRPHTHSEATFQIYGSERKTVSYRRTAHIEVSIGAAMSVVLPEGDTIRGVIPVTEILHEAIDSVSSMTRSTVRWFRPAERRPMAVAVRETHLCDGAVVSEIERCYAVEGSELRSELDERSPGDIPDESACRSSLVNATVEYSDGHIDVSCTFPSEVLSGTLAIGVTDVAGHLYAYEEHPATGTVSVLIPTGTLRPGEYVVGLSLSYPVLSEKRYIHIRP